MKVKYFAFGSNMSSQRLLKRTPSAKPIINAMLSNYELTFNKISNDGSGKANIQSKGDEIVRGVIFEMDETDIKVLDAKEIGYQRILIKVIDDRATNHDVYTYISDKINQGLKPTRKYLQYLISGAEEHKLPDDYQDLLKSFETIE
jgi:hypothetical protein